MASNEQGTAPSQTGQIQNVSIRVMALAHATNRNEDVHLVIGLDSTIQQLKERLQDILSQHPRPESQRLIYQGRPLTNNDATLRQTLRLEPPGVLASPHVLHLVIRDDQPTNTPNTNRPQLVPTPPIPDAARPSNLGPAVPPPGASPLHQPPGPGNLNALRQQTATLHQQMMANQQRMLAQMNSLREMQLQHQQLQPGTSPMPIPQLPINPLIPQMLRPQLPHLNGQLNNASQIPATPENRQMVGQGPAVQAGMTVRVHETYGPNGEMTRRVIHNGPVLPGHINAIQRSSSAPGSAPPFGTLPPATRTPDGDAAAGVDRSDRSTQIQPQAHPHPHPHPQPLPFIHNHLPTTMTNSNLPGAPGVASNPLMFLLTSPGGPEALLLAPNHGLFTSQPPVTATQNGGQIQPNVNQRTDQSQASEAAQAFTTPRPETEPEPRDPDHGQMALRRVQPPVPDPGPAQPARRDGEDVLALVLQRGWLFLRLYMFIFVLSEAGTWRRYVLLTIASLVCLLPRNNPFNDMFQAARRHFDNLIGPPQPPAVLQEPRRQMQGNVATPNGAEIPSTQITGTQDRPRQRGAQTQMPTPEEHARRLLQEDVRRNSNVFRETFYRVEQALVLFLASLIPGVGERHVRAREEARRVVQEEEQRRRREENERAQQEGSANEDKTESVQRGESGPSSSHDETRGAVATGVDAGSAAPPTDTDEGVRMRVNDANI